MGAFIELLVILDKTLGTIKNYISAIRAVYFERVSAAAKQWLMPVWGVMSKGLANTVRQTVDTQSAISLVELEAMVKYCDADGSLLVLKLALVFGFLVIYACQTLPQTQYMGLTV